MTVLAAWTDGWRRAAGAPAIVAGMWLATLLVALPMALVLRDQLAAHLGSSLAAEQAASAVNFDWWNEFLAGAQGIGRTFVPAILGFAAVLKNVSSLADRTAVPLPVLPALVTSLALALFLQGGVLDRLARDRVVGSHAFFAACGVYFWRVLRLAVPAGLAYAAMFVWLHPLLFDTAYTSLTRELAVERTALAWRMALYAVFAGALAVVNVVMDYAKIRLVVEDRRSALGALAAGLRFLVRQPGAVAALYLLNTLALAAVLALYALAAPGASGGWRALLALLVGQVYLVLRVVVRVVFAASQIALFQGRLAHAGYTAAPVPAWPDSPAVEAIRPQGN
jgi:hypothetical protein